LNECEPIWDTSAPQKVLIKQRAISPSHPFLRHHKIKVGLFAEDGTVEVKEVFLKNQENTELMIDGSKNFKGIFLNYQDEDFMQVVIDKQSLSFFKDHLHIVPDLTTKRMIIRQINQMISTDKMSHSNFIDFICSSLQKGVDPSILKDSFSFLYHLQFPTSAEKEQTISRFLALVDQYVSNPQYQSIVAALQGWVNAQFAEPNPDLPFYEPF